MGSFPLGSPTKEGWFLFIEPFFGWCLFYHCHRVSWTTSMCFDLYQSGLDLVLFNQASIWFCSPPSRSVQPPLPAAIDSSRMQDNGVPKLRVLFPHGFDRWICSCSGSWSLTEDYTKKSLIGSTKPSNNECTISGPKISQSAAIARAWQDAALARQLNEAAERCSKPVDVSARGRVLICAQSNAAVDDWEDSNDCGHSPPISSRIVPPPPPPPPTLMVLERT